MTTFRFEGVMLTALLGCWRDVRHVTITNTNAMASPICSWCSRRWKGGGM
jgi:hypothetical protein